MEVVPEAVVEGNYAVVKVIADIGNRGPDPEFPFQVRVPDDAPDRRTPQMVQRDTKDERLFVIAGGGAAGSRNAQWSRAWVSAAAPDSCAAAAGPPADDPMAIRLLRDTDIRCAAGAGSPCRASHWLCFHGCQSCTHDRAEGQVHDRRWHRNDWRHDRRNDGRRRNPRPGRGPR